ncbi:MAG: ATPase [Acidobacteria bacterium]|nr:MAG: ATPase [Acidobacteriota bacterium]REK02358.1 MAG: ATPase [Acidobacteriota bacterium]REK13840.1 MAG: ATPase [Acidobacteriota bacterium]REK41835.1 MAG: ATPase [Acidobacteriota bacterium]
MKIKIETLVRADAQTVWDAWNDPEAIKQWNSASDDWHTTASEVDLRVGGKFSSRMEAKDGSMGFDFEGEYTTVEPPSALAYRMSDGREVTVEFEEADGGTVVRETFDAETENDPEYQKSGWQSILDNFGRFVESV